MSKKIKVYQSKTGSRGKHFDNCRMYDSTSARRSLMVGGGTGQGVDDKDKYGENMDRIFGPSKIFNQEK